MASAIINGGGGTLVAPLMSVWQGAYGSAEPQITVNYNAEGSGAGITDFTKQVVNFGESDAPMTTAQYAALTHNTTALTVPISASAVVPAYNLKLLNGSVCQNGLNFTGAVLANIFLGTVSTWNDPSIQALQSPAVAAQLPNTPIITVHRSDGSGTMFAFSDFLSDSSSQFKTTIGESTTPNWVTTPGGTIAAPKNAGVAGAISENNGAIGPLEIAYILENTGQTSLYYGTVENAAGNFILANVYKHSSRACSWSLCGSSRRKCVLDNCLHSRQHIHKYNSHNSLPDCDLNLYADLPKPECCPKH